VDVADSTVDYDLLLDAARIYAKFAGVTFDGTVHDAFRSAYLDSLTLPDSEVEEYFPFADLYLDEAEIRDLDREGTYGRFARLLIGRAILQKAKAAD